MSHRTLVIRLFIIATIYHRGSQPFFNLVPPNDPKKSLRTTNKSKAISSFELLFSKKLVCVNIVIFNIIVSITSSNTPVCLFFFVYSLPINVNFFTFDETKTFCIPPEASLRTTGWEPLIYQQPN